MRVTEIIRDNFDYIKTLYGEKSGNITHTAEAFCKEKGFVYGDYWRRAISKAISEDDSSEEVEIKPPTPKQTSPAKILIFDIETAPASAWVWGGWNQNPSNNLKMIQNDWFMLTWSAKWLFEDKVMTGKLTPEEAINEDDRRITKGIWELLDEADVVVAHNALKFDIKKLNTRFLLQGLDSPSHYQVIDTLVHARKRFSMMSNRLDYLAKMLKLEGKLSHEGFELWAKCMKGVPEALDKMEEYNIQDIAVLEEVYLEMRPWIKPHPNMGLFIESDETCCPTCGSSDLKLDGTYKTYVNSYDTFRCGVCGSLSRSRKTNITKEMRENIIVSLPN